MREKGRCKRNHGRLDPNKRTCRSRQNNGWRLFYSSQDKSNQNTNLITNSAKLRFLGTNHSRFNKEVENYLTSEFLPPLDKVDWWLMNKHCTPPRGWQNYVTTFEPSRGSSLLYMPNGGRVQRWSLEQSRYVIHANHSLGLNYISSYPIGHVAVS